jgi:hypothetical protein
MSSIDQGSDSTYGESPKNRVASRQENNTSRIRAKNANHYCCGLPIEING